jgi:large subunit ribosomal protein L10
MSKLVKGMMIRDYQSRLGEIEDAMLISIRGISTNKTNVIRAGLREKNIHITIIRNSLAKKAFEGTNLASLSPLLSGASALAYGAESVVDVARELVDLLKKYPDIELKGAVLDGQLFTGEDGVKALSKFPTRDEAIGQAVTLVLSPGRKLVAAIKGPGSKLVGIVKTIEEKLEKGETISKL